MTDFAWFPATGDGQSQATAVAWKIGAFPFATGADWLDVDVVSLQPTTGTVPGAVAGGVPQDSVFLAAGQAFGQTFNLFYQPDPGNGDPFLAADGDGNYDFPADVVLNSGSVALNTLGLEQANGGGSFAPTLDIEGATLDVTGSVVALYSPNLLPPGPSSIVAEGGNFARSERRSLLAARSRSAMGVGLKSAAAWMTSVQFNGGTGNVLRLDSATLPFGRVLDFTTGDTIDFGAVAPGIVRGVAIGPGIGADNSFGNTLIIDETNGTTITFAVNLSVGLARNFAGATLTASSDGAGGTDISFAAPVAGETLSDNGTSSNLVGDANDDIFIGTTGNDTIITGIGHNLVAPGSGNDIILASGSDVIFPETGGSEAIFALSPVMAAVGAGHMAFVNGDGQATVFGGGSGSATINGGAGGGLFAGGTGGLNIIEGGSGACTMFGSSGSDLLAAGGLTANLLIAGSGNETLTGIGSLGANVMFAGAGNDLLGGGTGKETFFAGHGNATVIGGTGADLYGFINGFAGGTEAVFGFSTAKGDLISLQGYGANEVQNDLANATVAGGNTTLTLSDHTQVTFMGVTGLSTVRVRLADAQRLLRLGRTPHDGFRMVPGDRQRAESGDRFHLEHRRVPVRNRRRLAERGCRAADDGHRAGCRFGRCSAGQRVPGRGAGHRFGDRHVLPPQPGQG